MKDKLLKQAYNNVLGQTISESGRFLFAGNRFGEIFVMNINEFDKNTDDKPAKFKKFNQGKDVEINCLCFHRDFLIVGSIGLVYGLKWDECKQELSSMRNWEIKIPMDVDAIEVPDINNFWLCTDSETLFAACGDNNIYQISLEDGRIVRDYRGHSDYVHDVTGCENNRLYSAGEDGALRFWARNQKEQVAVIEPHTKSELMRPDWGKWLGSVTANNDWLICGGGPQAAMWHLRTMEHTNSYAFPGRVHICEMVDDSILIAGEHNHAQFYSWNGNLEASIPVEHTACYSVVWQTEPLKFMSIAGFSNKLHILKDFRFLDSKIPMYSNIQNETDDDEDDDLADTWESEDDESDSNSKKDVLDQLNNI